MRINIISNTDLSYKEKTNISFFDDDKFFITIKNSDDDNWVFSHNEDRYVLRLTFDDIIEPVEELKLFNKKQANKIKNFVDNLNPKKILFINCPNSSSRSIAIGAVINEYLNNFLVNNSEDYEYFLRNNDISSANEYIKTILTETFFEFN